MGNGENTELLDLKMKTTESSPSSYPYKRTMFLPPSSHPHFAAFDKETSSNSTCLAGGGGGGGNGDFEGSDSYDAVSSGAAAALSSRPLQPFSCSASTFFQSLCYIFSVYFWVPKRRVAEEKKKTRFEVLGLFWFLQEEACSFLEKLLLQRRSCRSFKDRQ